jgi:hypothetical protein
VGKKEKTYRKCGCFGAVHAFEVIAHLSYYRKGGLAAQVQFC